MLYIYFRIISNKILHINAFVSSYGYLETRSQDTPVSIFKNSFYLLLDTVWTQFHSLWFIDVYWLFEWSVCVLNAPHINQNIDKFRMGLNERMCERINFEEMSKLVFENGVSSYIALTYKLTDHTCSNWMAPFSKFFVIHLFCLALQIAFVNKWK